MKYYLLFITIFFSQTALSQEQLIVESSVSKRKDSLILYANIPNYISLVKINGTGDSTPVHILPGDRYKVSGNDTQTVYVELYSPDNIALNIRAGGEVETLSAEVRLISDPYVALNRERDTTMYKNELLEYKGLVIFFKDKNYTHWFIVANYKVAAVTSNGMQVVDNEGPYFNKGSKKLLQDIKRGTKVHFEDIRVIGPGMRVRAFNSFWVKVL